MKGYISIINILTQLFTLFWCEAKAFSSNVGLDLSHMNLSHNAWRHLKFTVSFIFYVSKHLKTFVKHMTEILLHFYFS